MSASVHVNPRVTEPGLPQCVNDHRLGLHVMTSLGVPVYTPLCVLTCFAAWETLCVCVCVCVCVDLYVGLSCVTLCMCVIVNV